jgi:archaellum biogenesis ATPase FlaH
MSKYDSFEERTILKNLMCNQPYISDFIDHIDLDYMMFHRVERMLLEVIKDYYVRFKQLPTKRIVEHELKYKKHPSESDIKAARDILITLDSTPDSTDWLYAKTDEWISKQAFDHGIFTVAMLKQAELEGKKTKEKRSYMQIMQDALNAGRCSKAGLAFVDDVDALHDFYQTKNQHIPFDLSEFNRMTSGGLVRKRMMGIQAGTGVGKTMVMCHIAAGFLNRGFKVLYISLEVTKETIAHRIDANLLDLPMSAFKTLSKADYIKRRKELNLKGELVVEEYSPKCANANDFRALLKKLEQARKFVPDVVIVDHITNCASAFYKRGGVHGSYTTQGSVAEELYALAKEHNVTLVTGTQSNRDGVESNNPGMHHAAESMAITHVCDIWVVISRDDNVPDQLKVKVEKNRHDATPPPFRIRVDYTKQKLYDGIPDKGVESDKSRELYKKLRQEQQTNVGDIRKAARPESSPASSSPTIGCQ